MMICPNCNSPQTLVTDSRQNMPSRRRRYKCHSCGQNFSTIETYAQKPPRGTALVPVPGEESLRIIKAFEEEVAHVIARLKVSHGIKPEGEEK